MTAFALANLVFATLIGFATGILFYLLQCAVRVASRLLPVLLSLTLRRIHHLLSGGLQ